MKPRFLFAAFAAFLAAGPALAQIEHSRLGGTLPGKRDTGHRIVLDAEVSCTPTRSYELWTTTAGARSFFAPSAEIGGVGGPYTIAFFPQDDPRGLIHGTFGAHVLAAEPGRFFAFEWVVFAGDRLKGDNAPPYAPEALRRPDPLPTWVELTFAPSAAGTHVAFRHYGFAGDSAYRASQAWFTRAWGGVLDGMRATCAGGR
jgi:Activator of Hsp90 ATPase homolog 1-like protein